MQVPPPAPQLTKVLAGLRHTFVVADATLPDCPLVFASEGCAPALVHGCTSTCEEDTCLFPGKYFPCEEDTCLFLWWRL